MGQLWRSLITCHVMTILLESVDTVVTFSGFMSGSVCEREHSYNKDFFFYLLIFIFAVFFFFLLYYDKTVVRPEVKGKREGDEIGKGQFCSEKTFTCLCHGKVLLRRW